MKARALATDYPTVSETSGGVDAARLLTEQDRPGLIVIDDQNHPVAVLPGSQVLRLLIPGYIRDDRTLAGVVDDDFVDHMCDALEGKTVRELLPKDRSMLPVVGPDETLLEVAALMAAERSPIVAVVEGPGVTGAFLGAITLPVVLRELLPKDRSMLPVVGPDETLLEVAALMAAERSPIVAVVEGPGATGAFLGAITLPVVLRELLPERITGP